MSKPKRPVAERTIVVKQLGGELSNLGLWIADQPNWKVDEQVLLFLSVRPRDGTLTTTGLSRAASASSSARTSNRRWARFR